ncbi:T9SS type A sorting domain-containing protein [Marinoscillum furvescens]|uniref:Putative secreted protein (Por secretion system target) n=1 Tax=Marinoscillum furvescens DSM 4134 TaxID=1122208 RepID=A0A3D9L6P6_MARFU|nr:T9SS type A sorting domain-containing protein [Marinoscillum furvescens]REE02018.1 putative secreted protein (Por secretion system target) [Marinoscillum furvescens DSM 4134]
MMNQQLKVMMLGICIALANAAMGQTYYVDPINGSDGNSGTSSGAAFETLTKAKTTVNANNNNMSGDITVYLMNGVHTQTSTLNFDAEDGGTNGHKVIYKALSGHSPVISGHKKLTGWTLYDASKNIYRTSCSENFRTLYVNYIRAIRARHPNRTSDVDFGPYYTMQGANTSTEKYKILKSDWDAKAASANKSAMEIVVKRHWIHDNALFDNASIDGSFVWVQPKDIYRDKLFNKNSSYYNFGYYFENSYDFVDAEGEWFLDTINDYIYYKPRAGENMSTVSISHPNLTHVIKIEGTSSSPVKNLQFEGITIQYSKWTRPSEIGLAATQGVQPYEISGQGTTRSKDDLNYTQGMVKVIYAEGLTFKDCTFRRAGATALQLFSGCDDIDIQGNEFVDIGANGIEVGADKTKNPSLSLQCNDVHIWNNEIHKVGQQYTNGDGIQAHFIEGLIVDHNEIYDCPYSGMDIGNQNTTYEDNGMANNRIRYNRIYDTNQLHDDGGGIYTLARQYASYIYKNYVSDVINNGVTGTYTTAGIYMDNYTEFYTTDQNVISNTTIFIHEQTGIGARNNEITNNVSSNSAIQNNSGISAGYVPANVILGTGQTQAENLDLMGYTVEAAQGRIMANTVNYGSAQGRFTGTSGSYDLEIRYGDEPDGASSFRVFVNSSLVDSWTANQYTGGSTIDWRTRTISNVTINNGDYIRLESNVNTGEMGRYDWLDITASSGGGGSPVTHNQKYYIENRQYGRYMKMSTSTANNVVTSGYQNEYSEWTALDQGDGTWAFQNTWDSRYMKRSTTSSNGIVSSCCITADSKWYVEDTGDGTHYRLRVSNSSNMYADADDSSTGWNTNITSGTSGNDKQWEFVSSTGSRQTTTMEPAFQLNIYPNPVQDALTVQLEESGSIEITDLSGKPFRKLEAQKGVNEIVLTSLPNGIYVVTVKSDKGCLTQRILKQ